MQKQKIIIELQYPIETKLESGTPVEIRTITLRRLRAGDLRHLPKRLFVTSGKKQTDIAPEEFLPIISRLAELPEEQIDELDMTDLWRVVEAVSELLGESGATEELKM